jgi:hypothetical protein
MNDVFSLKRTVIGGQTSPDEWSVMLNGETVGRILPRVGNPPGTDRWQWFVTLPLPSPGHGTAPAGVQELALAALFAFGRFLGARFLRRRLGGLNLDY